MKFYKLVIACIVLAILSQIFACIVDWVSVPILDALDLYELNYLNIVWVVHFSIFIFPKLLLLIAFGLSALGLASGSKERGPLAIVAASYLVGMGTNLCMIIGNIWTLITDEPIYEIYTVSRAITWIAILTAAVGLIWLAVVTKSIALRITSIIFAVAQFVMQLFYYVGFGYIGEHIKHSTAIRTIYEIATFVCDFGPELLFFAAFIHFAQSLKVRN